MADPTDDSEAVSDSALRSRSVLRSAMPRPRVADVAVRTVSVEAVPVAVPLPGDEDELDVCWRACLVMVMKEGEKGGEGRRWGLGIGDWGREGGFGDSLDRSDDRK